MNPAFDPFDPMAARRPTPGATTGGGGVATQLAQGGGGQLAQTPAPQLGSPPVGQFDRPRPRAPTGGVPSPAPAPTGGWTPPSQYSRFYGGGNIGQSAPGSRSTTGAMPVDNVGEYPWMQDQSIQWGGGPFGYLPIGYVPQDFNYYSQGNYGGHLAPWEYKYMQDTFTQNYNPSDPGYINTANPAAMGRTRG